VLSIDHVEYNYMISLVFSISLDFNDFYIRFFKSVKKIYWV